jgi:hypothetical protein
MKTQKLFKYKRTRVWQHQTNKHLRQLLLKGIEKIEIEWGLLLFHTILRKFAASSRKPGLLFINPTL